MSSRPAARSISAFGSLCFSPRSTPIPARSRRACGRRHAQNAGEGRGCLPSAGCRRAVGGVHRAGAGIYRRARRQGELSAAACVQSISMPGGRPRSISAIAKSPLRKAMPSSSPFPMGRANAGSRPRCARGIPLHSQRPLSHRASAFIPADSGRHRRYGGMDFRFSRPSVITISGADRLIGQPREELAAKLWREIS